MNQLDFYINLDTSYFTISDYTKLMVIGGYNRGTLNTVEVVNLDDPIATCDLVANYPTVIEQLTVGLVNGVVKACGGCNTDNCYDYHPLNNRWVSSPALAKKRNFVRSSIIDGIWLVSGDDTVPNGNLTELWAESEFVSGPDLPQLMYGHCQITVNATHVFFADCETLSTYLLDWDLQEWVQLDSMSTYRNNYCGCGLINNENMGKEVVVAGYGTSEIFNMATMTWRAGPNLPDGNGYASVQLTNTFLLVGGQEQAAVYSDKIYIFDEDAYVFNLKSQTMQYPRRDAAAVVVPDDFVDCS